MELTRALQTVLDLKLAGGWHNDKLPLASLEIRLVNAIVATPGLDARLELNACVCQN